MRYRFDYYAIFGLLVLRIILSGYTQTTSAAGNTSRLNLLIEKATQLVNIPVNHDSVHVILNEADQLTASSEDQHLTIEILILKGMNEFNVGDYEQAVDCYYRALDLAEQTHDSIRVAKVNYNLGKIYNELEDYDKSISFFEKSLKISQTLTDTALIAKTFQNIAISYQDKKDLVNALEYNKKANQLAILRKDTVMIIDVINNFGTIAYDQQKLDESLAYYQKALNLYRKINKKSGIAFAYNNIGLVYLDKKEYEKSLGYFKKSLALANELNLLDFKGDIYGNLTIYYEQIKDYRKAYYYYNQFNVVYDSLAGEKKHKMINQIQAKYQLQKNNRELEELKSRTQAQQNTINSAKSIQGYLVSLAILFIILIVTIFYFLFKEKRLARELKLRTEELHNLNASKDKFFSIIAHDLKNPFNVLVSYTSILKTDLQMFSNDELQQIISDLNQASENGFNLLQNLLLWTRSQTNRIHVFKTNFNLSGVCKQVKNLVELNLLAKNQSLSLDIDQYLTVYADKDMISTVLRNLVFNAIKFSSQGAEIIVKASLNGSSARVDVIDSGIGIAAENIKKMFMIDDNTTTQGTEGETGTGLGLVICREFVEKNNGSIWVESKLGEGSTFSFTIPLGSDQKKSSLTTTTLDKNVQEDKRVQSTSKSE